MIDIDVLPASLIAASFSMVSSPVERDCSGDRIFALARGGVGTLIQWYRVWKDASATTAIHTLSFASMRWHD